MPFLCQQWLGFWGPSSQHDIINGVNLTWTRQIRFAYRQRYLSTSLGLNQGSRKYGLYSIGTCTYGPWLVRFLGLAKIRMNQIRST